MGQIVAFTDNINDLSNEGGFQFEFVCERCGNGYRSPYMVNNKERGRGLLRSAGSLFGGKLAEISGAAEQIGFDRASNSAAKDKAMKTAVEAVRDEFRQCRNCGNWVCAAVCWNDEIGQCLTCSPSVAETLSAAQAAAQVQQIQEKAQTVDWTADLDVKQRAKVKCPHCGASVEGGKFCPECGKALSLRVFCGNCGAEMEAGKKFCSECGQKL
jgi:DNA-directed RNA polymerase subunit M/transcription elongation factor TFIIS